MSKDYWDSQFIRGSQFDRTNHESKQSGPTYYQESVSSKYTVKPPLYESYLKGNQQLIGRKSSKSVYNLRIVTTTIYAIIVCGSKNNKELLACQ